MPEPKRVAVAVARHCTAGAGLAGDAAGGHDRRPDRAALRPGDGPADGPAAELGLFTSILTAPVTALLGRNPVLIGGTASATVPFIAGGGAARGRRRRGQGLPGGLGLPDDLLGPAAGPVRRQGPARGRLGLLVRRGRDDGRSSSSARCWACPPPARRLRPARSGSSSQVARRSSARHGREPLSSGSIVIVAAAPAGPALAAVARGAAGRRPGGRWRAPALGWRERTVGAVPFDLPPVASFTWKPPT